MDRFDRRRRYSRASSLSNACSLAPLASSSALPASANGAAAPDGISGKYISHIVIIIQENRSFDNFFAGFPGADGATQGLMKTPSGDKVVQLQPSRLEMDSLGHEHHSFELEYDHGKLDGFNLVKRELAHGMKVRSGTYAYRYVEPTDIAPYWTMAQQYVLGDHMFSTQSSSSFTAHQDLIAGGTPIGNDNVIDFPTPSSWGCNAPPGTVTSLITVAGKYLLDKGPFPCFKYPTLRDLLDAKKLPWLYFTNTSKSSVWNAFDAIDAVRNGPQWETNIVTPQTRVYQSNRERASFRPFRGFFRMRSTPTILACIPIADRRGSPPSSTPSGRAPIGRARRSSSFGTIGAATSTT